MRASHHFLQHRRSLRPSILQIATLPNSSHASKARCEGVAVMHDVRRSPWHLNCDVIGSPRIVRQGRLGPRFTQGLLYPTLGTPPTAQAHRVIGTLPYQGPLRRRMYQ
jgi:hypothetical protein